MALEGGITTITKEEYDLRSIMLDKVPDLKGRPFRMIYAYKMDTPARAFWASMEDSGILFASWASDESLPTNVIEVIIGRKPL
jgi:hypothetical protein